FAAKPGPAAGSGPSVPEWSQCANGTGTALTCAKGWINGDLQANNSHFREDDVVPQRAVIKIPSGNTTTSHTIAIRYLIRKGSANAHSYDSLATWNDTVTSADPCQSLSPCPATGTASKVGIPDDPSIVNPVGAGISNVTSAH